MVGSHELQYRNMSIWAGAWKLCFRVKTYFHFFHFWPECLPFWPFRGYPKKTWMGLKLPFPLILVEKKHTFFPETFHFLPEYTFWFFIFSFLAPKTNFLGFKFFFKKPKNQKILISPPNPRFLTKLNSWAKCSKKLVKKSTFRILKIFKGGSYGGANFRVFAFLLPS